MEGATRNPLPRSLSPLDGESLPGYVLRLAHRLGRSPARTGHLTGLAPYRKGRVTHFPVHQLVAMRPHTSAQFAAATRLAPDEVAALGLRHLTPAYTPLARAGVQDDGRVLHNSWAFMAASRFCPTCLIGDHSPVQRAHGGAWLQRWHLPVIFVCARHRRMLETDCPQCHRPTNVSVHGRASLVLHPASDVLHPAQCRNHDIEAMQPAPIPRILCGADLTDRHTSPAVLTPDQLVPYLALQQRIEHQLNPAHTGSGYFADLITVAQLIKLSWPTSQELAPLPSLMSSALDAHVEGIRRELANTEPGRARNREMAGPPSQALPCAALLLQADQLRSVDGPAELHDAMQTLADRAFHLDRNRFRSLFKNASLSEPFARALAPQRGGFLASPRSPRAIGRLRVPSRESEFSASHVPQLIPLAWYHRHFQGFTAQLTVPSRDNIDFVRRAASLKLVEMVFGGTVANCAQFLGMPAGVAQSSLRQLRRRCPDAAWARFQEAVEEIAHEMEQAPTRTDFARRRHRLARWEIPSDHWLELTHDLRRQLKEPRHRKVGSVIVWTRATEGDHLFSPLIRADGTGARLPDATATVSQLDDYSAARRGGRSVLRDRLERYAGQIADRCDLEAPFSHVDTAACLRAQH
ncbi:TniQ family protein [Streptomyces griseiscabiei]|uniref:TniQ family protein n=2 Tax=Streptomyces griseiscabiei TaxID=2993540 RepID=A0ABU4L2U6_9ACTN|nr:TniQ family protein [Streptomyces griseiscabiei]MBZ3901458.1 TniQ family protein [Streptomyces griseiscabiei]MDX2909992.1 TniQ family protein [Streptomyces griseiscabiei]